MKHDFRKNSDPSAGKAFSDWLETDLIRMLKEGYGNIEQTQSAIFLYTNRAFESGMVGGQIAEIFGRSVVKAGYTEDEENFAFDLLENFSIVSRSVHSYQ